MINLDNIVNLSQEELEEYLDQYSFEDVCQFYANAPMEMKSKMGSYFRQRIALRFVDRKLKG